MAIWNIWNSLKEETALAADINGIWAHSDLSHLPPDVRRRLIGAKNIAFYKQKEKELRRVKARINYRIKKLNNR